MAVNTLISSNLNGQFDALNEAIFNISPEDTLLVSLSKKETAKGYLVNWQKDALDSVIYDLASTNEVLEGADVTTTSKLKATDELSTFTQIFRKAFAISDTALSTGVHGRKDELKLQIEKAGKELLVWMEKAFSSKQTREYARDKQVTRTDGLFSQIAALDLDPDHIPAPTTKGDNAVHRKGKLEFDAINNICTALYRAGSKANVILVNPVNFEALIKAVKDSKAAERVYSVGDTTVEYTFKIDSDVSCTESIPTMFDTYGQVWEIRKSRFMPVDLIYFIDPDSFTQRILRPFKAEQLGKQGSYEQWQLVIETAFTVSHPFANGVLEITP